MTDRHWVSIAEWMQLTPEQRRYAAIDITLTDREMADRKLFVEDTKDDAEFIAEMGMTWDDHEHWRNPPQASAGRSKRP